MKYLTFVIIYIVQTIFFIITIQIFEGKLPIAIFVVIFFLNLFLYSAILERLFKYKSLAMRDNIYNSANK